MTWRAASLVLVAATACGPRYAKLPPAGVGNDDGAGLLARASTRLLTDDPNAPAPADTRTSEQLDRGHGAAYGGAAYGGTSYGGWQLQWTYSTPSRVPTYNVASGLSSAIEGVVRWTGPRPRELVTACGTIPNPSLRVGRDGVLGGVIVYITKVATGRPLPYYSRPLEVGGMLEKRGCTLVPAAQVVTPLPASLEIVGDASDARVRVTGASGRADPYELEQGGLVRVVLQPGVTEVAGDGGKLGAAWALAITSPYYAITDDAGRYRIDELAPGTYDVTFWQPPIGRQGPGGTIAYGAPIVAHRTVQVGAGKTASLRVDLSGR